jgi:hypothetical protein
MTCGGRDDEDERMKRSSAASTISLLRGARASIAWCMVGTAVYQVGSASASQPKNFSALKPGVHTTLAPALRLARIAAMSPWMWNSGMTFRQRSPGVSARVVRMLRADAQRFLWLSGTILGRDVVPDVCRTSATSSPLANPPRTAVAAAPAWPAKPNRPACSLGTISSSGMPSLPAALTAGDSLPFSTSSALAFRSER